MVPIYAGTHILVIDKTQVPHRDEDAVLHPCSQRRRREATAAFLRSFKEALIGERLHLETIRERERHTHKHQLRHVTVDSSKTVELLELHISTSQRYRRGSEEDRSLTHSCSQTRL